MAKISLFIFLVGLVFSGCRSGVSEISLGGGTGSIDVEPYEAPKPVLVTRERVIRFYQGEVGVRELTGKNDGKRVEQYLKTVGLGKGYAWCAAYIKFCFSENGVNTSKINGLAASLYDPGNVVYYKGAYKSEPLRADVFTIYSSQQKRIIHTGFYDGVANKGMGTIFTNEGNTNGDGSADGNGVYRRIRQLNGIYAINRWIKD